MKKIISVLILSTLFLSGYAQSDSSINIFNDLRVNQWAKKSDVPSYEIDGYRAIVFNGDTLVRINSGVFQAEEAKVYADGNDMSSALQDAFDYENIKWISFGSDSSRVYVFNDAINAHGKTIKFENGNMLSGTGSIDSIMVDASDYDQIFGSSLTLTNVKGVKGYITPNWWGAKGDGVTDATIPIQKSFNIENAKIRFPEGRYYTTDSLLLTWSSTIQMPVGSLILSNTTDRPAIVAGDYTATHLVAMRGNEYEFRVERYTQSNWTDSNSIGVKLVNLNYSKVKVMIANRFTIGMKTIGYNAGFAYVDFQLGVFERNLIGIKIATLSPSSLAWNNQNNYYSGWIRQGTDNPGVQTFGVWIGNGDYAVTNNIFTGTSFEMSRSNAIPFYIQSGTRNKGEDFRSEGNSDTVVYVANRAGTSNIWNYFFAGRDGGVGFMVDSSNTGRNFYSSAENAYTEKTNYTTVVAMDDIAGLCSYSGDDSAISIRYPGYFQYRTGAANAFPVSVMDTTAQIVNGYLMMDANHLYGLSTDYIDVSVVKSFVIKQTIASGSTGAGVGVVLYNSSGAVISSTAKVQSLPTWTYSSTYGGVIFAANTNASEVNVTVPEQAAKMRVILMRTVGTVLLKSLRIVSHDPMAPGVYSTFSGQTYYNTSPSIPSIGSYIEGRIILNSDPEQDSAVGWVCTKSGTFGTLSGVTGSISNTSAKLTLNSGSGAKLRRGDILQIGTKRISVAGIDADTAYLNGAAPSTLSGAAINYAVPEFTDLFGGGGDLTAIQDSIASYAQRLDSLEKNDSIPFRFYRGESGPEQDSVYVEVVGDTTMAVYSPYTVISTYTPAVDNTTNIESVTPSGFKYKKTGNLVEVWGYLSIETTSASSTTAFTLSLPISSNLGSAADLTGVLAGGYTGASSFFGIIRGEGSLDLAVVSYTCNLDSDQATVNFTYTIQ